MRLADEIVSNAKEGTGPCAGCPAHETTGGWCVNPGLSNPRGRVVFVTEEPSHSVNWDAHESWQEYSEEYTRKFRGWKGGRFLQQHYLGPFGLSIDDAWITDSIKCRPENAQKQALFSKSGAADHCRSYLMDELSMVDPVVIITLGSAATHRTLTALGVPEDAARGVKVSRDFGLSEFQTPWPVVVTLHWAQRTVKQARFLPVVKQAIHDCLENTADE